ncbi:PE-PPE, C-terminal [Mycobacteriaceae bacterium]
MLPDRRVRGLPLVHGGFGPGLRRGVTAVATGATVVAAALAPTPTAQVGEVALLSTNALIMAGTDMHDVDQAWVDMAIDGYIRPSLGGDYTGIPVVTPAQFWPFGGRDDMFFDLSVLAGTTVIDAAIDATTAPAVVFGYSQSSVIATAAKRRLAERAADAANAESTPPVSFVMLANLNRPNGGLNARFPGAFIEELGWTFSAAAPTDTGFTTIDVARQYDLFADFPRYPLNVIATANAVVALLYSAHDYSPVTLNPADPRYDPNTVVQQFGDTTYYLIPTPMLPLLRPLRDLGFDPVLLDAVEPAMRVLVEFGYDRSTPFGQPTGAQLTPRDDFEQLDRDLAAAIEQGRAILDAPKDPSGADAAPIIPAPSAVRRPPRANPDSPRVQQAPGARATRAQSVSPGIAPAPKAAVSQAAVAQQRTATPGALPANRPLR